MKPDNLKEEDIVNVRIVDYESVEIPMKIIWFTRFIVAVILGILLVATVSLL